MSLSILAAYLLGFIALLVLTQDIHIFPGAFISKVTALWQRNKRLPPNVDSRFIQTSDRNRLEVWRYSPDETTSLSSYVALIFHGNGGSLEHFIFIQIWLAELGIRSYSFDYRGYGRSSGWPSEKGIYLDSDAVWQHLIEQEQVESSNILVFGISVGGAPAARIAAKHHPKLLLLSSAFTDLKSTVRAQPLVGLLWPFVRHTFPTQSFVEQLEKTDLLLVHGKRDNIVPTSHAAQLESAYQGVGRVRRLTSEDAGHNLAFYALKDQIRATLIEWL